MSLLSDLPARLRKYGLTVVETYGWDGRGYLGQDLAQVRGVLWHHTATNRERFAGNDAPTLQMCINGRPDCAGPLCNIVFGRNGTVYLVASGVANHAGAGSAPNIPTDLGNHYLIGIEMESSGVAPFDWTEDQIRVAPYLGAALELEYLQGWPAELRIQIGHKEYSSEGKIDPAGWPGDMDGFRDSINSAIAELQGGAPAPAPAPPAATPAPEQHGAYEPDLHWEVDPGDSLAKIAAFFGTDAGTLAHYNGISDPDLIQVGEWIWPPVGQGTWTIDPGDTLTSITRYYGGNVTMEQIQFANGINDANVLPPVGRRLQIPWNG